VARVKDEIKKAFTQPNASLGKRWNRGPTTVFNHNDEAVVDLPGQGRLWVTDVLQNNRNGRYAMKRLAVTKGSDTSTKYTIIDIEGNTRLSASKWYLLVCGEGSNRLEFIPFTTFDHVKVAAENEEKWHVVAFKEKFDRVMALATKENRDAAVLVASATSFPSVPVRA
jgi:hypothetical protein